MGVEVGSGVKVAVGVFSTGCDVDVDSTCSMGTDVDAAGLAQADRNIIIANNRDTIRFMVPHFVGKTKGRIDVRPYFYMSLRGARRATKQSPHKPGIASSGRAPSPFEARRNDI